MAEKSIATVHTFEQGLFQVRPGAEAKLAISFADTALVVCQSILSSIIQEGDDAADPAFACRFLIDAAIASYRSAGRECLA